MWSKSQSRIGIECRNEGRDHGAAAASAGRRRVTPQREANLRRRARACSPTEDSRRLSRRRRGRQACRDPPPERVPLLASKNASQWAGIRRSPAAPARPLDHVIRLLPWRGRCAMRSCRSTPLNEFRKLSDIGSGCGDLQTAECRHIHADVCGVARKCRGSWNAEPAAKTADLQATDGRVDDARRGAERLEPGWTMNPFAAGAIGDGVRGRPRRTEGTDRWAAAAEIQCEGPGVQRPGFVEYGEGLQQVAVRRRSDRCVCKALMTDTKRRKSGRLGGSPRRMLVRVAHGWFFERPRAGRCAAGIPVSAGTGYRSGWTDIVQAAPSTTIICAALLDQPAARPTRWTVGRR